MTTTTPALDHEVSRYALNVLEGKIVAGELVKLACERHLRDLKTGQDRGLIFDPEAASRIIRFAKMLHHTAGPKAGQPLALEPWQAFRMGSVFGWKHESTGLRRFRDTYHQVGKKNGKTTDTAVPMIYTQVFDGESAPEAYCAATTRDQANILFKNVKRVIKRSPFLGEFMDAQRYVVETPRCDGQISCLSRDGNSADGINPSFLARDEMHRWSDRELAETIVESMAARAQPIDWVITTAGHDRHSLCGELRTYAESVLTGAVDDDAFFAYVAEPQPDADPMDPVAWAMANPNLGVSKSEDRMRAAAEKASAIAGSMPNFRRFHLDLWTEGAQGWIAQDGWDGGGAAAPFDMAELFGRDAWLALDLSKSIDLTALAGAVPVEDKIFVFVYSFIPSGPSGFIKRAQSEKREYVGWRDQGWLEVHDGGAINKAEIIRRMEWLKSRFRIQEVAYDPWSMRDMAEALDAKGFTMVEHRQGFASMSEPMKRTEELVAEHLIRHGGNPVLTWAVGNVHRDEDPAGNIKPNKKKSTGRIDPAVAMIMAIGRAAAGRKQKRAAREIETV